MVFTHKGYRFEKYENGATINVYNHNRFRRVFRLDPNYQGKGIENVEMAKQPLYTTKANLERSGMGFTIMESFMDAVEVESVLGLGTKVTMRRKIKSNSQDEEFAVATIRGEE